ncbi:MULTISPECIES: PQQ-binding-like beta-propeller repeat protein [unclassified Sphingomonas]|jgi:outer membrane protein assembly factor BamB|uniref:outer membrane protein assembly factor BamB family protein n=1 Tax=unclassified Sphingomonas TaxID=196159 RepID=UPI0006F43361|nr:MULTISPECIES: PQQ-binding-like beta-propeller repeat protein [unclassified Sphingomonas]KQN27178.1 pyrrolo-quinoline quinone [Sphingomonas sp. Leaf34]KQN31035.1 pyrrolo-quinoline quinone [Sphingomonas sp. Leaf38]
MMKTYRVTVAVAALVALSGCGIFKGGGKKTPTLGDRVSILVSENEVETDKTIADVQVLLPAPAVNDAWSQPGGNPAKSMGQLALADQPKRLWQSGIDGGSNRERLGAAPVVADGKLFVTDVTATIHAFTADTGAALWSAGITEGDINRAARFGGGVSYDDGKLYATDGVGDVVAMSAADGKILWRAKPGAPLRGAPTVANGAVYVLTQDNQVFSLNQTDGKVQWVQSGTLETQGVFGVAAPAVSQGTVVAGFSSGELSAYRYENGRILWQDALSRTSVTTSVSSLSDIDAAPVIDGGRVYAVGQGGRMVALELSTGQRLWEQNFAGISTPWIAGEWLFVVTDDAKLVCLSRSNGKARWIAQLKRFQNEKKRSNAITWFGPILAGNRLILTNSRGEINFVSPTDGTISATIETKTPFSLPPIVANSTLYTLDQKGKVTAYR